MNPQIFRAYDVRGVADVDLTDDVALALGRAYAAEILAAGGKRVTLGRDCRLHGPRLRAAFATGLLESGLDVIDVGVVPSPLLYFSVFHHDADGGVQITGSHNPSNYNGFKMMQGKATADVRVKHNVFAVQLRNVRCTRCGAWGHQATDRECPMRDVNPHDEENKARMDPLARAGQGWDQLRQLKMERGSRAERSGGDVDGDRHPPRCRGCRPDDVPAASSRAGPGRSFDP